MTATRPPLLLGCTVRMTRPRYPWEQHSEAVVLSAQPGLLPLEGGGGHPVTYYELQWPDGSTTWHLRYEFQAPGDPR